MMKATRVQWESMWEKYFGNYQGWLRTEKCEHENYRPIDYEPGTDTVNQEEFYSDCFISDPEDTATDKFYLVEDYYDTIADYQESCPDESGILARSDSPGTSEADEPCVPDQTNSPDEQKKENECQDNIMVHSHDSEIKKKHKNDKSIDKVVRCKPIGKNPDNIVFECDTGTGFAFVTQKGETLTHTPYKACILKTLGIIAIDTSCLKKPQTKVLYSCNICFKPRDGQGTAQLEFVLSRSAVGSEESQMGNWVYDVVDRTDTLSQTFRFNFCSCNSFPGCYYYFVRVIPVYIKNCVVCITNCHMDAFAQSAQYQAP